MHMLMTGALGHRSNLQVKQERAVLLASHDGGDIRRHVTFHWDLERAAASVLSCPCACANEAAATGCLCSVSVGLRMHAIVLLCIGMCGCVNAHIIPFFCMADE